MLNIEKRCAQARLGIWSIGERTIRVPTITYVTTQRMESPDCADLLLTSERTNQAKISVVDRGSQFRPLKSKGDITIGADLPYPLSLREVEIANGQDVADTEAVVILPGDTTGAQRALQGGASVFVLGNAIELIRHPKTFIDEIVKLRESVGYSSLIYLPGIATPSNLAFLCYCGGDILDSTRIIWESRSGHVLTPEGRWPGSHAEDESFSGILDQNYSSLQSELDKTIHHTESGTLREFVEKRAVQDAWMIAALRHFDLHHYDFQELHFSISGPDFNANTKESLHRPDIIRYRNRIKERFRRPESANILLLLPCSARKPYSLSKTHALYRKAISKSGIQHRVHEVIVTSPLGIVPRELELFHPAQDYDIPVTGHWSRDEIAMVQEDLLDLLDKNRYDQTIAHLGSEKDFVCEVLEDVVSTSDGNPTSESSLEALTKELSELAEQYPDVRRNRWMLEEMTARCVFQFGEGGKTLTESAEIKGRYPGLKIFSEGKQLGMLVEQRGMLSLTLDGAELVSEADAYCVEIDDFYPEGNLFAIGVEEAVKEIRIGDEVVVRHDREVRAVGVAMMNWKEMVESERGEAVRIRHRRRG